MVKDDMTHPQQAQTTLRIYYDGGCPFCAKYVTMLRLVKAGEVQMVDVRADLLTKAKLERQGFSLDEGMVVEHAGRQYGGSDAVAYLAPLITPSDAFNRLNRAIFSIPFLAFILYPLLRSGRWLALFLIDRRLIDDFDDQTRARREIFTIFFSLFSIFHFFNYAFEYDRFPPSWDLWFVLTAAFGALIRPTSSRMLFALVLASTVSTFLQAPVQSNHTMVRLAALLGYWLSFFVAMVRNEHISKVFERFAPAGCAALLVMYFFGIFHKINADFLNPITSCATALWRQMPFPLAALEGRAVEYATIYGTFAIEGLIAAALISRRFRHVGVAAGMAFHLMLSLSAYAMYISFTMLALALHTLFLSEESAQATLDSPLLRWVNDRLRNTIYRALLFGLMVWLSVFAFLGNYTLASLATFPLILPFCLAVLRHGYYQDRNPLRVRNLSIGILVGILFFANCALPYLGLKSGQAVNMFANLRLEGGVSNHLIFSDPNRPFPYLDRVASLTDDGGDPYLSTYTKAGREIIFYELLSRLEQKPDLTVSFVLDGREMQRVSSKDLLDKMEMLHPWWVRKFFNFQPVELSVPEYCNV